MTSASERSLPTPGWWKNVTVQEFFERLHEFQQLGYTSDEVEFTHNVSVGNTPIGQAGLVEWPLKSSFILGFFQISQLPAVYGLIDRRFTVYPKL